MSLSASSTFSKRSTSASVASMDAFCARRRSIMSSERLDDGKNCCCTKPNRITAITNAPAVPATTQPRFASDFDQHAAETRGHRAFGRSVMFARRLLLEHGDADVGREDHRHHPRHQQRDGHHGKQREAVFAGAALRETDRQKSRHRHQRAGEHGKCRGGVGEGGGAELVPALFHLLHHHLDRDHGVIDQQARER